MPVIIGIVNFDGIGGEGLNEAYILVVLQIVYLYRDITI
jgi:hypothetical protein